MGEQLKRMAEHGDDVRLIEEFVDWLEGQEIRLECVRRSGRPADEMQPHRLAATFFGIDLKRLESERRELLASVRDAVTR